MTGGRLQNNICSLHKKPFSLICGFVKYSLPHVFSLYINDKNEYLNIIFRQILFVYVYAFIKICCVKIFLRKRLLFTNFLDWLIIAKKGSAVNAPLNAHRFKKAAGLLQIMLLK